MKGHPLLYSLFEHVPQQRRWRRITPLAFELPTASRVFQNALLAYIEGGADHPRMLRPVGHTIHPLRRTL
jgi:plasmid stabilization system protein ParE